MSEVVPPAHRACWLRWGLAPFLTLPIVAPAIAAQAHLVADLNRAPGVPNSSAPTAFGHGADGRTYFSAQTGLLGRELFYAAGAAEAGLAANVPPIPTGSSPSDIVPYGAGVAFLADSTNGRVAFRLDGPGQGLAALGTSYAYSDAHDLVSVGARLFFFARDTRHGDELWSSAGTAWDTHLVADLNPGVAPTTLSWMVPFGDGVVMLADDGVYGFELWTSDGTEIGTRLVRDLNPGTAWGGNRAGPARLGHELFFGGDDGTTGVELFATDGTEVRLVADLVPGAGSSAPEEIVRAGGRLFLSARSATGTPELYVSDGTAAGTRPLATGLGRMRALTPLSGGRCVFVTQVGTHEELAVSDGTTAGTRLLGFDIGIASSTALTSSGDLAYLYSEGRLVVTDGTAGGTRVLTMPDVRVEGSMLADASGRCYFAAATADHGNELWTSDGTVAGTRLLADLDPIRPTANADPTLAGSFQGDAIFGALTDTVAGQQRWLFASDGTRAGTRPLMQLEGAVRHVASLQHAKLLFDVSSSTTARLIRTDGTAAGSFALAELLPLTALPSAVLGETLDGRRAVLGAFEPGTFRQQLWATDGTVAGTQLLATMNGPSAQPVGFLRAGDVVYFLAPDASGRSRLWRTDGTPVGTRVVATNLTASAVLGNFGERVLIAADDGVTGTEVWISDGTATGTALVVDWTPGPGSTRIVDPGLDRSLVAGRLLIDTVDSGVLSTDGTAAGTAVLPVPGSARTVSRLDDFALLVGGPNRDELFRTDGTAGGTGSLGFWLPRSDLVTTRVSDGRVAVDMGSSVHTVLVTDGTTAGTVLLDGTVEQTPVAVDGRLLFRSADAAHGTELFALDTNATSLAVGLGCGSHLDGVRLRASDPRLGSELTLRVDTSHATTALVLGAPASRAVPLPLPGCALFVDPLAPFVLASMPPSRTLRVALPLDAHLIGVLVGGQAISGPSSTGADLSNGVHLRFDL